jgi:membrane-bound lytic murein transglycosylase D
MLAVVVHDIVGCDECWYISTGLLWEVWIDAPVVSGTLGTVDVKEDTPSVGRNYSYSRSRSSYSSRSRSSYSRKSKKSKKRKTTRSKSVTIKNGDTLSEIAARNHTTVKKLRKLNGISGNTIRAGKKIKVK